MGDPPGQRWIFPWEIFEWQQPHKKKKYTAGDGEGEDEKDGDVTLVDFNALEPIL